MIDSGLYQNKTTAHLAKCRCRVGSLALYNSISSDQNISAMQCPAWQLRLSGQRLARGIWLVPPQSLPSPES